MPERGLRLLNETQVNLQGKCASSHTPPLHCCLGTLLLAVVTANNSTLLKLVDQLRGLKIESRYCGSLDAASYVCESDTLAGSADLA